MPSQQLSPLMRSHIADKSPHGICIDAVLLQCSQRYITLVFQILKTSSKLVRLHCICVPTFALTLGLPKKKKPFTILADQYLNEQATMQNF